MSNIILHNGDCFEVFHNIPDKSIDLILTDLPYGKLSCKWDIVIPFTVMWENINRVIKPNAAVVLFASQPFTSLLITSNIKMFRYEWIWQKNTSGSFVLAKKQPMKYHENICVFYNKQPTYNPIFEQYAESTKIRFPNNGHVNCDKLVNSNSFNNIQSIKRVKGAEMLMSRGTYPKSVQYFKGVHNGNNTRLHPSQKPVDLLEYLIKTYTNEGELVLDFTMGSGSTGVACKNTNRNFIGIEKDEDIYNTANNRLKD